MTHATKSDAGLLRCGCHECKCELAYRDGFRSGKVAQPEVGRRGPFDAKPEYTFDAARYQTPLSFAQREVCPIITEALDGSSIYE